MAARSFTSARLVLSSLSNAISRRGYATQGAVSAVTKRRPEDGIGSAAAKQEKSAWGPDPKTGYYRPENLREEIDVAELRAVLLTHKD